MPVSVMINEKQLRSLQKVLRDTPKEIDKHTAVAINKTATAHMRAIGKRIRKEIAIDAKGVKESLEVIKKAKGKSLSATVQVKKHFRPSLKRFKPKQTAKGVSYRISKQGGRKTVPGAFGPLIPRLGHHVWKRETRKRTPIYKLRGPSLWGVYRKLRLQRWSRREVQAQLNKEIEKRVKFILFKAQQK